VVVAAVIPAVETTATATKRAGRSVRNIHGALQLKRPVISPSQTSPFSRSCFASKITASFTPTCGRFRGGPLHNDVEDGPPFGPTLTDRVDPVKGSRSPLLRLYRW
jgi:hypothetical protein